MGRGQEGWFMFSGWMLPHAELLALDRDLVTLQLNHAPRSEVFSADALAAPGVPFRARFRHLRQVSGRHLARRIRELGYSPRRYVCCCRLEQPLNALEHLRVLLEPLAPVRETERVPKVLRVRSLWLPEYTAIATDISRSGLGMRCRGPIEAGLTLPLRIDSEEGPFELDAEIRWCREEDQEHHAGAHFESVNRHASNILEKLTRPSARPELTMFSASERRVSTLLAWT